jgi:hypothetical protein
MSKASNNMREQRREKQAERRSIFEWCLLARNYTLGKDLQACAFERPAAGLPAPLSNLGQCSKKQAFRI